MLYQGWVFEDYVEQFNKDKSVRYIEPMSAHEINILEYETTVDEIAELKFDGHRGRLEFGESIRCFSRTPSKKSRWYTENTDNVPHIRDLATESLRGTMIDGEFDYGTTSMGVQSVMGSLPERAVKFQEENGNITYQAFDILYYKGINIQKMPLWKRKIYLAKVIMEINSEHMQFADIFVVQVTYDLIHEHLTSYEQGEELKDFILSRITVIESYKDLYNQYIEEEKEGIMLKSIYGIYEQKRSKAYLKVKGQSTWDCVVMGYTESTKVYEGKEIGKWKFWEVQGELYQFKGQAEAVEFADNAGEEAIPVTKPYFHGWCGGISFGVWKDGELVQVGDCKGLTEKIMKDIKLNGENYIGRVVEVKANGIIDEEKGSLRHPRFSSFREDKTSEMCIWEDHNRKL